MIIPVHCHRAALAAAVSTLLAGTAVGQTPPTRAASAATGVDLRTASGDTLYASARQLIDDGRFSEALGHLDEMLARLRDVNLEVAEEQKLDAALYWKAYSLAKQGEATDAMAAIADLERKFPGSGWVNDAKALELEIRQAAGQAVSPEAQANEDLKLLALRGLMQSDPDRALPLVDQILSGDSSVRVKENALFLLSQSRSPEARQAIASIAKGASNPELQLRAVRYLGVMRDADSRRLLGEIYRGTSDAGVKHAVLRSFMVARASDALVTIARTETDASLRRDAIRTLGLLPSEQTAEALRSIYASDAGTGVKNEVIQAFFLQRNAAALVQLARAEPDPSMKKAIVERLALMKSPEATDYLLELLK